MKAFFKSAAALLAVIALFACPAAMAVGKGSLQVIGLRGQLLDPAGQEMAEYDYLEPGRRFRLMPGAKAELSSLDGKRLYVAKGPAILDLDKTGRTWLNGKPLIPGKLGSGLAGVKLAGGQVGGLGAVPLRSHGSVMVEARDKGGKKKLLPLYSGYYALVVGCGDYKKGWVKLPNPVKDAAKVAAMLKKRGWEVDLLEDPDWAALRKAMNRIITGPGRKRDQAVLFWFSGHGHTLEEADGSKLGYIVPVDAPDPAKDEMGFMEKGISMRQVETVARRIKSKHVLMVFDSCFSGALFSLTRAAPSPYIEEKVTKPVRQFITAGTENEKVPDESVFKTVFLQGVKDGEADLNEDGYVTGQELGAYLQERVINFSRAGQHPQYGKINNPKLDKGDFVFSLKEPAKKQAKRTDPKAPDRLAAPAPEPKTEPAIQVKTAALTRQPSRAAPIPASTAAKPKEDRAAILTAVQGWEKDWNSYDAEKILAHYARDAVITTKTGRGIFTVRKEKFKMIVRKKAAHFSEAKYARKMMEPPEIKIEGGKAKVEIWSELIRPDRFINPQIVDMLEMEKRNGRWLITKYNFERI